MLKRLCLISLIGLLCLGGLCWPVTAVLGQSEVSLFVTAVRADAFPDVQVDLRAVGGSNQVVNSLSPDSLAVFESGQPVKGFQLVPNTNGAVQIIFVLDLGQTSGYQYFGLADIREAFTTLVAGGYFVDGRDTVQVLGRINTSSDQTVELVPATQKGVDLTKWAQSFDFKGSTGATKGLLGVDDAIKKLLANAGTLTTAVIYVGRRIEDPPSNVVVGAATSLAQKATDARVLVYAFHTGGAGQSDNALSALAKGTNGIYLPLTRGSVAATTGGVYQAITSQRTLYTVTYRSTLGVTGARQVKVVAANLPADSPQGGAGSYEVTVKSPVVKITAPADGTTLQRETETVPPKVKVAAKVDSWPDNHPRNIVSAQLVVNGLTVETLDKPNKDGVFEFGWDISGLNDPGIQSIPLEVKLVDELGQAAAAAVTVKVEVAAKPTAMPVDPCVANPSGPGCQPGPAIPVWIWAVGGVGGGVIVLLVIVLGVVLVSRRPRQPVEAGGSAPEAAGSETILVQPSRPAVTLAQLRILQGPPDMQGRTLDVSRPKTVIGRAPQAAEIIFYADDERSVISRRHCSLDCDGMSFTITDHSANGTSINGRRLTRDVPTPLNDGDEVLLGGATDLLGVKFSFVNMIGKTQVWSPVASYPAARAQGAETRLKPEPSAPRRVDATPSKRGAAPTRTIIIGLIAAALLVLCCGGGAVAGWFILSGRTPLYSPAPSATLRRPSATTAVQGGPTATRAPTRTRTATPEPRTATPEPPTATLEPPTATLELPTTTPVPVSLLCPAGQPVVRTGSTTYQALTISANLQACGNNQACAALTFANSGNAEFVIQIDKKSYGTGKAALLQGKGFAFVSAAEPESYAVYVSIPPNTPALAVCLQFDAPAAEASTVIFQWVAQGTASGTSVQVKLQAP